MKIIDTKVIEIKDEDKTIIEQTTTTTTTVPIEQKKYFEKRELQSESLFIFSVVDLQSYNPGKSNYDAMNDACWKLGEK